MQNVNSDCKYLFVSYLSPKDASVLSVVSKDWNQKVKDVAKRSIDFLLKEPHVAIYGDFWKTQFRVVGNSDLEATHRITWTEKQYIGNQKQSDPKGPITFDLENYRRACLDDQQTRMGAFFSKKSNGYVLEDQGSIEGNKKKIIEIAETFRKENKVKELKSLVSDLVKANWWEIIPDVIQAAGLNDKSKENVDALTIFLRAATELGYIESMAVFINEGADVNGQFENNLRLLHVAVQKEHSNVIRYLVHRKANIEGGNSNGQTPLHCAAIKGRDIVETLLELHANIHAQTIFGNTPLHLAVDRCKYPTIQALLKANADIHIQNQQGVSVHEIAVRHGVLLEFLSPIPLPPPPQQPALQPPPPKGCCAIQ